MSISEFFNHKARVAVAATAFGLAGLGGFAGHELTQNATQPQVSNYTLSQILAIDEDQLPQGMVEEIESKEFFPAVLPAGLNIPAEAIEAQERAVTGFQQRLVSMAFAKTYVGEADSQTLLKEQAVSFINDLRLSTDISERDYSTLLRDYNTRIGLDVSDVTGNYTEGVMYQQEAGLAVHFAQAFGGFFDDDDMTDQQVSRDIGDTMQKGQSYYDNAGLAGGLAGGAVGFMLMVPMWMRLRRSYPKLN